MRSEIDGYLSSFAAGKKRATAVIVFPESFSGFQGHFPDRPILPGVCQISLAMAMADRMCGKRMKMRSVANAKFVSMVLPNQPLEVCCTLADGLLLAELASEGVRVAEFKLRIEDA